MQAIPLKYPLRNLKRRPARTLLAVGGLALLVAVIVFLVAFARSFQRSLRNPGHPRNLVVLSKKAQTFEFSSIAASELDRLRAALTEELEPGRDGEPLLSAEVYHFVNVRLGEGGTDPPRRALVHGIEPELAEQVLAGFRLVRGELPGEGEDGLLVGRAVADHLGVDPSRLDLDADVLIRDTMYSVSGVFEAPGSIYENWILARPADLRVTLGRRDFSFARMRVRAGVDPAALARRLSLDERYQLRVLPETEYFADFMEGFAPFRDFALLLALILGVGGVLTGMNTMHNAVAGRIGEVGVLRVLGFRRSHILLAFLVESVVLTGAAGLVACALSLLTNGLPLRVPVAAAFRLQVDAVSLAWGLAAALAMGVLGVSYPMLRALRMPAVAAVRANG